MLAASSCKYSLLQTYLMVVGVKSLKAPCRAVGTMTGRAPMTGPSNFVNQRGHGTSGEVHFRHYFVWPQNLPDSGSLLALGNMEDLNINSGHTMWIHQQNDWSTVLNLQGFSGASTLHIQHGSFIPHPLSFLHGHPNWSQLQLQGPHSSS